MKKWSEMLSCGGPALLLLSAAADAKKKSRRPEATLPVASSKPAETNNSSNGSDDTKKASLSNHATNLHVSSAISRSTSRTLAQRTLRACPSSGDAGSCLMHLEPPRGLPGLVSPWASKREMFVSKGRSDPGSAEMMQSDDPTLGGDASSMCSSAPASLAAAAAAATAARPKSAPQVQEATSGLPPFGQKSSLQTPATGSRGSADPTASST
mmetsp:Transcript_25509/g.82130  ORF Transcript_25509/g.82130 Transcript_25509/m.82130 type:complete len:211 (+) Transcript_25509:401-1033(+)